MEKRKTVGIVGGMGPAASCLLYKYIIDNTVATCDQDHIHLIIDSNNNIPDRTESIKMGTHDAADYIVESAERLVRIGAEILAIPCNTSHYFYEDISKNVNVPIINMIEETAMECKSLKLKKIGILATDGTIQSQVYEFYLKKKGIIPIVPSVDYQFKVMRAIYDFVKAGKKIPCDYLNDCIEYLNNQGCEGIILGCTELPFIISNRKDSIYIDSLYVLAKAIIRESGYKLKNNLDY